MTDLVFKESRPSGREIVFRRGRIIGDIIPDASGRGGWVWFFDREAGMPRAQFARTRADARALFALEPVVPNARGIA